MYFEVMYKNFGQFPLPNIFFTALYINNIRFGDKTIFIYLQMYFEVMYKIFDQFPLPNSFFTEL